MKSNKVCNNNIMLTMALVLVMSITLLGGIRIVKAGEAVEYEKSFVSIEIQQGDTLSSIAEEYATSEAVYDEYIEEVKTINNIKDDVIHHGCYLLVPVYHAVQ